MLESIRYDVRHAVRGLLRDRAFTVVALLSIGLGVGANSAIFSLVDQALYRRLPVREPDRLVLLDWKGSFIGGGWGSGNLNSHPMFRQLKAENQVFEGMFARHPTIALFAVDGGPEPVNTEIVSGSYFGVLGVRPAMGRLLDESDDITPGGHPVVALSYDYWKTKLGGRTDIVGRKVLLNNYPMTVVGVAAEGFRGVDFGELPAVFVPTMMKRQATPDFDWLDDPRGRWLHLFGRLKPGVSRAQAAAWLQPWFKAMLAADMKLPSWPVATDRADQGLPGLDPRRAARGLRSLGPAPTARAAPSRSPGRHGPRSSPGLPQRRQPLPGARLRPAARDGTPPGRGRLARPDRPRAARAERPSRPLRCFGRDGACADRHLGARLVPTGCGGPEHGRQPQGLRLRAAGRPLHRPALRPRARAPGEPHPAGLHAEGRGAERGRWPRPPQSPRDGTDYPRPRPAERRRPLRPHPRQPARPGARLLHDQPGHVRPQHQTERLQPDPGTPRDGRPVALPSGAARSRERRHRDGNAAQRRELEPAHDDRVRPSIRHRARRAHRRRQPRLLRDTGDAHPRRPRFRRPRRPRRLAASSSVPRSSTRASPRGTLAAGVPSGRASASATAPTPRSRSRSSAW